MRYKLLTLKCGKSIFYLQGNGNRYRTFPEVVKKVLMPSHALDIECRFVDIDELKDESNENLFFRVFQYSKEKDFWTSDTIFTDDFNELWEKEGVVGLYEY